MKFAVSYDFRLNVHYKKYYSSVFFSLLSIVINFIVSLDVSVTVLGFGGVCRLNVTLNNKFSIGFKWNMQ
jgi:hypothetical protein